MRLILVRHGATRKNKFRKLHSKGDPESLTKAGEEQMKKTALRLKEFGVSKLYSSKEKRALRSATIIGEVNKLKNNPIDNLQERNWGIFAGRPWGEVEKVLKPMTLQERYNYVPENGESWKDFETRLISTIRTILENEKGENITVVTHGGSIRALMPFLLCASKEESFKYDPDNASLTVFEYNGKKFKPITINDTSHLE